MQQKWFAVEFYGCDYKWDILVHFGGASIMTEERHAASSLDVIAFPLANPDVGLPASWMLLWLGSADLPQGSITSRCTSHEDSFNKDMPTNKIKRWSMFYSLLISVSRQNGTAT